VRFIVADASSRFFVPLRGDFFFVIFIVLVSAAF